MHIRVATGAATLAFAMACGVPNAQAQITVNLHQGDFTYQFADPVTGLPITTLAIPAVGGSAKVAVYLIQNTDPTSTPPNLIQQLGAEGLGVRLNYTGGAAQVPTVATSNIIQRPGADYTLVQRYGSNTGTNTLLSAAISDGLTSSNDPLPFPGTEDPLNNPLRMLIGTFNFSAIASGTEIVTAVSGPSAGVNNLSGPNPLIMSTPGGRSDGSTGPVPGNGAQGEIDIDQFLSTTVPTLSIIVPSVPEPSTLALSGLAALGLAAWRRRRKTASIAA